MEVPAAPKDDVELELEKLVFGDEDGFRRGLRLFDEDSDAERPLETRNLRLKVISNQAAQERDLAALEDSELFYFDTGSGPAGIDQDLKAHAERPDESAEGETNLAWVDSDDERVTVSLASTGRLRKLRRNESEDVVNGVEYTRRLCQQFERLYPPPDWAVSLQSKDGSHRKKRRKMSSSSSGSDDTESDAEAEGTDTISTQPLAQLLQSTTPLVQMTRHKQNGRISFRPEILDIQRVKDISASNPSSILSLSFHPTLPLLLSSGTSGLLTLHHIAPAAPTPNPVLTRVAMPHLQIQTSVFHPSGTRIILAGRRRYYHVWDLESGRIRRVTRFYGHAESQRSCEQFVPSPCGRYIAFVGSGRKGGGVANVVDASTGQWVCAARVEGRGGVADLAWWSTGDGLCVLGKGGDILEYNVCEQRPVGRWFDEGAVGATVIALGGVTGGSKRTKGLGGDRFIAIGSSSGIVNIYDRSTWGVSPKSAAPSETAAGAIPERPTPTRTLDQLVTSITQLRFSPDGQLLAMCSQWKRDAVRLVHLPTCTVYKNWPTSGTPLGRVTSLAWGETSEEGGLCLAVANEQGKIRMWQVMG